MTQFDESEMDKISPVIEEYHDLGRGRWSELTASEHLQLADLCRTIKWRLGHEIDFWHRTAQSHVDRYHQVRDLETRARDRKRRTGQ
jgi:hypothetical protein